MLLLSLVLVFGKVAGFSEHLKNLNTFSVYIDFFYAIKMSSRYQCMELCTQFTMCKAMTFQKGNICYLHDHPRDPSMRHTFSFGSNGFFDKPEMAKYIVDGACINHNCSIDTVCLPLQATGRHACVPHGLPIFSCPLDWLRNQKKCYRPIFIMKTWQEAKEFCLLQNASLTEIHNSDAQMYLKGVLGHYSWHLHDFGAVHSPGGKLYWTALTDQNTEGKWIWNISDSEITQESFVAWATPRNNSMDNDCVGLSLNNKFNWMASDCSEQYFFVCEFELNFLS